MKRQRIQPLQFVDEVVDDVVADVSLPHRVDDHSHNVRESDRREIVARTGAPVLHHAGVCGR